MTSVRPPITDSPWLWAALFTGVALSALLATGGKFGKRQANIETKYQARRAVAAGKMEIDADAGGRKSARGAPEYSTPDTLIVPLWPLEIALGAICAASVGMLVRSRVRGGRGATARFAPGDSPGAK